MPSRDQLLTKNDQAKTLSPAEAESPLLESVAAARFPGSSPGAFVLRHACALLKRALLLRSEGVRSLDIACLSFWQTVDDLPPVDEETDLERQLADAGFYLQLAARAAIDAAEDLRAARLEGYFRLLDALARAKQSSR